MGAPRVRASSSFYRPLLVPLELDDLVLPGSFSLTFSCQLPFSFSAAQSRMSPPMVTPETLRAASTYCTSMRI